MAFTDKDRRVLKNAFNSLKSCAGGSNDELRDLLQQILDAILGQKDYEIVCITNDGGDTIVKGIQIFDVISDPPTSILYYEGQDVTGQYEVIKCDPDCDATPRGVLISWGN